MSNKDYSYYGSGMIHLREFGAKAPLIAVGNCSKLELNPQTETKKLTDFTQPGGGTYNQIERVTGMQLTYAFHDFSPENFARALRGSLQTIASGTATDELAAAYKGGLVLLDKIPSAITSVMAVSGATEYELGDDYEIRNGGIFIPEGSSIPAPTDGAPNIKVTYSYSEQSNIAALVNPGKTYELVFTGLNEAREGKEVVVQAFRATHGILKQLALIADDYGVGEVDGELLPDNSRTGAGVSKYFEVKMVK